MLQNQNGYDFLNHYNLYLDFSPFLLRNIIYHHIHPPINLLILIVDFYFYESDFDNSYIIEKWNFEGMPGDSSKDLRIPKIFTHPIKEVSFKSHKLKLPSQPEYLCEFLYGSNWRRKLKKDVDYDIKVFDGKPVKFSLKKNFFGKKKIVLI